MAEMWDPPHWLQFDAYIALGGLACYPASKTKFYPYNLVLLGRRTCNTPPERVITLPAVIAESVGMTRQVI